MAETKLFSPESEEAVLTMLLKYPDLIHSIDGLRSYMFSAEPHINLFAEMENFAERQLTIDPTLITESLASKNQLDSVGGKFYINKLLGKDFKQETFPEYVKIVVSSYKGRTLLSAAATLKKENLNSENLDDTIITFKKKLEELLEMRNYTTTVKVEDLAVPTYETIIARLGKPGIRGISWGVESVDRITGGKAPGDLVIIAGRPGSGKTTVVCNSIMADALAGKPVLLIEKEMRPQELMERMLSIDTGIPSTNIRMGILSKQQIDAIYESLNKLKKFPIYLDVNFRNTDPYYCEALVNKYHNKHGVEIAYLDYVQMATERNEDQTQEIGRYTRMFKVMANDLGICSILCSQLNRNVEAREDKRPMLSDMKQSGAIEEDADFVIGLYRDEYYHKETKFKNLMEYIILKQRNGPTGTVTVKFDAPTYKISEA